MAVIEGKENIITKCKEIALSKYEEGYDVIIECWDTGEWDECWHDSNGNLSKMKKSMAGAAEIWLEQLSNTRYE